MDKCLGRNNLKIHISINGRRVLENVIPKSIDKKVFIGYNVDIFLFYSLDAYLVNEMNIYA